MSAVKKKDVLLSVAVDEEMDARLKVAAKREGRSVAGFMRWWALKGLDYHGLIPESEKPAPVPPGAGEE